MLLYICLLIFTPLSAYVSFKKWESLALFNTALVGAYAITRALSVYIGHFPSEFSADSLEDDKQFLYSIFYLVMITMFTGAGLIVQMKKKREAETGTELEDGLIIELNSYS